MSAGLDQVNSDQRSSLGAAELTFIENQVAEFGTEALVRALQLMPFLTGLRRESESAIKHMLIDIEDGTTCTMVSRYSSGANAPRHVDHSFFTGNPRLVLDP